MMSCMHRRAFAASAVFVALPWPARAEPPLPQRNLVVEARVAERSGADRQGLGAAGGVVVGTSGSTVAAGSLTLRAGSAASSRDQVQRVLVLNGGSAMLRMTQLVPLKSVEWIWTPQGASVSERTLWVDLGRGVEVRPAWPGGQAPVVLEIAIEAADTAAADPAQAPRLTARTQVALPLGEWVPVASFTERATRSATPAGLTVTTGSARHERGIELRVTLP
jgi:hypothetical protein